MKERIKNRIRRYLRVVGEGVFYGETLTEYVQEKCDRPKDTILRYLREMKKDGELDYDVVNQGASEYNLKMVI